MKQLRTYGITIQQGIPTEKRQRARELRHALTGAEHLLWERLRNRRLQGLRFRRQQLIDGFIVDFYCHSVGLVVEVDGAIHSTTQAYDTERDQVLARRGLRVLRVSNTAVYEHIDEVLQHIASACMTDSDDTP